MGRIAGRLRALALALGAPGLFLIAFLDSSFLSLPEIADLLVVYMVTHHKSRVLLYAVSATLGSIAGCLVMYYIGKKGGDALMRRRFTGDKVDRAMRLFQRHGVIAVLVPSLLPPPAPFKIFVILAGMAGIPVGSFTIAVVVGRGLRYLIEALLAYHYGQQAIAYINDNMGRISLWMAVVATVLGV
ncbi:MAG TPA: VTT domain-containing protein, partial [Vicinamibacterales bacterium]|nr:VTT domain-containing protein [Vicinamibacterales bacterium]